MAPTVQFSIVIIYRLPFSYAFGTVDASQRFHWLMFGQISQNHWKFGVVVMVVVLGGRGGFVALALLSHQAGSEGGGGEGEFSLLCISQCFSPLTAV